MKERSRGSVVWLFLAAISFFIALLAAFGVILASDGTGRLIYGVLWGLIGLGWLGRYFVVRKKTG